MNIHDDFLWVEKYRPNSVKATIIPESLKSVFQGFVNNGTIPNLILAGTSGVGKTTIARAMVEEIGSDYIIINGSLNGNIDTLRNEILNFASSVSLFGGRKYVIIDEADYLNANSTQPALRGFIEEFSSNCGFIFTCNHKVRLIDAIHSRCSVIDFKVEKKDAANMAGQFFNRIKTILAEENVNYDQKVVVELINKHFTDYRRIINELQRYAANGNNIDSGILATIIETSIKELVPFFKSKNYTAIRQWIGEQDVDETIYRKLYDTCDQFVKNTSVPLLITIIGKYQFQNTFSIDREINLMACLTEIFMECEFS